MKVSLHFQVLAVLYICKFVCGSEESGVAPSMDYPYIMHNMNKLADGWKNVVIRLSFLEDPKINQHLVEYEKLVHTNDSSVQHFLYKIVIQHCISRKLMKHLHVNKVDYSREEDRNDSPEGLLIKAIKLQLEVSESRISNEQFELRMMEENKFKLKRIDEILSLKEVEQEDHPALPVMREQMKYVAHTIAMEYIYLSMADSRISTFLIKLFNLMDVNKKTPHGFVYYDVILLFDPLSNFRIDTYDEGRDGNNFIRKFFMEVTSVRDYLTKHVRNKQQMFFQNQMMKNHLNLKRKLKYLAKDGNEDFKKAVALKLKYFHQKLNTLTTNFDIFQYKDDTGDSHMSLDTPISLVDFENDPTFTELVQEISYTDWNYGKKEDFLMALLMWTEEKLVMSIIADDDMFLALKQMIFPYIDNDDNSAKFINMVTEKNYFDDIMHIKNGFIPVFNS